MKLIVCLSEGNGMMFNNRRQSRDRVLIADMVRADHGVYLVDDDEAQRPEKAHDIRRTVHEHAL